MAGPATKKAPWAFFWTVIAVHGIDFALRYATLPWTHPELWIPAGFVYFILAWWARKQPAFDRLENKAIVIFAIFAYVWGPLWSILPASAGWLEVFASLMLLFAPVWPAAVLLFGEYESFWMRIFSTAYILFWVGLALFSMQDEIQAAAESRGMIPGALSPRQVVEHAMGAVIESMKNLYQTVVIDVPTKLGEEFSQALAAARGDYYTGQVDAAAQKRLGVYLDPLRPAESVFYKNTPITVFTTLKAETLDAPLDIDVNCEARKLVPVKVSTTPLPTVEIIQPIPATAIRPPSPFNVITSDQFDIDCIWSKDTLEPASYTFTLKAQFNFATRAYKKMYMMNRDRLREYRRQNVDPLAKVPDRNSPAVYTSGPLRIGMGTQQLQPNAMIQPIAIGERNEQLPPWGITLQNSWEGKVLEITDVFVFIPEGITMVDPEGVKAWLKADCNALPVEEQVSCDDGLVDVYRLSTTELEQSWYKNLTTKNIRVYVEVSDPEKVLGKAPIAVQSFKASVYYRYGLERSININVREST